MIKFNSVEDVCKKPSALVHAQNILTKKRQNLTETKEKALRSIEDTYLKYINQQFAIGENIEDRDKIEQRVKLLNDYYTFFSANGDFNKEFHSQSKLRSTILEEFLYLLFDGFIKKLKEEIIGTDNDLALGSAKAYTNLYFKSKDIKSFVKALETGINEKDQDFTIYRPVDITVNSNAPQKVNVPIVAVEVKTYIDKTMLEGIIATAEKIKSGNPYAKFYAITETYEVDLNVDPAYSRIDQIYVLRKSKREKSKCEQKVIPLSIQEDVVERFYSEIINYLQRTWGDLETKLTERGEII